MHWPRGQKVTGYSYENRHSHTVASDHGRYSGTQYAAVLPSAIAGAGLHVDTTACDF